MIRMAAWQRFKLVAPAALAIVSGLWSAPAESPAAAPPTVIIDPGHGGQDTGALGPSGAAQEKELTLALARKLAEVLEREGTARVLLTRREDQALGLDERAGFANHQGGDVLISLHVGNSFRPSPLGFSLYYWSPAFRNPGVAPTSNSSAAWEQGQLAHWEKSRELAGLLEEELRLTLPWPSGGLIEADLYLLKRVRMPAVLLELGSLNYPPEAAELVKPSFQEGVAHAVAEAVRSFAEAREQAISPPGQ